MRISRSPGAWQCSCSTTTSSAAREDCSENALRDGDGGEKADEKAGAKATKVTDVKEILMISFKLYCKGCSIRYNMHGSLGQWRQDRVGVLGPPFLVKHPSLQVYGSVATCQRGMRFNFNFNHSSRLSRSVEKHSKWFWRNSESR